jgi:hypothetical protein
MAEQVSFPVTVMGNEHGLPASGGDSAIMQL